MTWTDFAPFTVGQVVTADDLNELVANLELLHQTHSVRAHLGSNTAVTGVGVISWPTEDIDTDAYHSTSTNTSRFTIPADLDGVYLLHGQVGFASGISGTNVAPQIRLNGVTALAVAQRQLTATAVQIDVATIASLVSTDYVELLAGAAITAQAGTSITYFEATWLGKL